ncbi:MAG TPA: amidase family protein [Candidatus Dormibacteraeota bacterium]|nr:amidase family protein [Candidatus Dormibacteraeota bacterium]
MGPKKIAVVFTLLLVPFANGAPDRSFRLMETSIADVHRAMQAGILTCHDLVQQYLDRIHAYDQQGPAIDSMLYINTASLKQADDMDREFKRTHKLKPLGCIPIVLKDNFDTADMPTTAGAITLRGAQPEKDAFTVQRFREAGALILGKANLQEFASGGISVSSLGGQVKNPYDLTRTPGGSSGGTGAAVAANFAVAGTGSDTGGSIRSPASANSLVGLRPTRGLISRDGIVPVSFTQDTIGPMTRNVSDTARLLDVMAGYDPNDPVTSLNVGNIPRTYTAFLHNGLKGARLGVLTNLFGNGPEYQEVNEVMAKAIDALEKEGAVIVRIEDAALDTTTLTAKFRLNEPEFKAALNGYLQHQGSRVPVHSLAEIIASGNYHKPTLEKFFATAESYEDGPNSADYKDRRMRMDEIKIEVANLMAKNHLDALVYPHQKCLVLPIGATFQKDRNGVIAALAGFPAIEVPAGFSKPTPDAPIGVPVGMELLGRAWSEPELIKLAFGFEQATHLRKPPVSTPVLPAPQSAKSY